VPQAIQAREVLLWDQEARKVLVERQEGAWLGSRQVRLMAKTFAVLFGKESPLDATPGHVEDGVHEAFAIGWFADVEIGSGSQKF
jgi:hypothetical protein